MEQRGWRSRLGRPSRLQAQPSSSDHMVWQAHKTSRNLLGMQAARSTILDEPLQTWCDSPACLSTRARGATLESTVRLITKCTSHSRGVPRATPVPAVQAGTAVEAEAAVQRCTLALVLAAALPAPRLLHLRPSPASSCGPPLTSGSSHPTLQAGDGVDQPLHDPPAPLARVTYTQPHAQSAVGWTLKKPRTTTRFNNEAPSVPPCLLP